jgi:hypothetical protein
MMVPEFALVPSRLEEVPARCDGVHSSGGPEWTFHLVRAILPGLFSRKIQTVVMTGVS